MAGLPLRRIGLRLQAQLGRHLLGLQAPALRHPLVLRSGDHRRLRREHDVGHHLRGASVGSSRRDGDGQFVCLEAQDSRQTRSVRIGVKEVILWMAGLIAAATVYGIIFTLLREMNNSWAEEKELSRDVK